MFWSKRASSPEAPTLAPPAVTAPAPAAPPTTMLISADGDAAVEAAASILRSLGAHAFDVADEPAATVRERFDHLARHLLVLAPLEEDAGAIDGAPAHRRWREVVKRVTAHREREKNHVVRSATEMRGALVDLVRCLGRVTVDERRTAATLAAHVDHVKASIETSSLEELKARSLAMAEAVTSALEEQRRRADERARGLEEQLARVRRDLDVAKTEGAIDPLTKLQNRGAFDAALSRATAFAPVIGQRVSLVLVDIDHFKAVNDRYGHPVGDRVIQKVADCLARSFPRRGDVVARYGGEEFAILLADTPLADTVRLVDRLMNAVRALRIEHSGRLLAVNVSVGVGELLPGEDEAQLVERVDRALYDAKRAGRDRFVQAA